MKTLSDQIRKIAAIQEEEIAKLSEEEQAILKERQELLDDFPFVAHYQDEEWNREWPKKVAGMNEERLGVIQKIMPWLRIHMSRFYRLKDPKPHAIEAAHKVDGMKECLDKGDTGAVNNNISKALIDRCTHVFTLAELASLQQYRDFRSRLANKIFKHYEDLRHIWKESKEDIKEKWQKIQITDRESILLNSVPGISPVHRIDFLSLYQYGEVKNAVIGLNEIQKLSELESWAIINAEDLTRGDTLLSLLDCRANSPPSTFIWEDHNTQKVERKFASTRRTGILHGYVMTFPRDCTAENYGEIIQNDACGDLFEKTSHFAAQLESDPKAFPKYNEYMMGFTAVDAIEAMWEQGFLYNTLSVLCTSILKCELPEESASTSASKGKEKQSEESGPMLEEQDEHSLVKLFINHQYHASGNLDIAAVLEILSAKMHERLHEIHSLREDPVSFANLLGDYREHQNFNIEPETATPKQHTKGEKNARKTNGTAARLLVFETINQYITWRELHSAFEKFQTAIAGHQEELNAAMGRVDDVVPIAVSEIALILISLTEFLMEEGLKSFSRYFAASPNFRPRFQRKLGGTGQEEDDRIKLRARKWDERRELNIATMIVGRLLEVPKGYPNLMYSLSDQIIQDLEHYLEKENISKDLTPLLNMEISNLCVIGACWTQVFQLTPWNTNFEWQLRTEDYKENVQRRLKEYFDKRDSLVNAMNKFKWDDIAWPFCRGPGKAFEGSQTAANTKERQDKEKALKRLWEKVIKGIEKVDLPEELRDWLQQPVTTTPNFTAGSGPGPGPVPPPVGQGVKRTAESEPPEPAPPKKKNKVKKKGVADPSKAAEEPAPEETPEEVGRVIAVKQRELDAFNTIFFQEGAGGGHGTELPWTDFLRAMRAAGFNARSLRGSEWNFEPPQDWNIGSINFHAPHPNASLRYLQARSIGRRLTMRYNLDSSSFVLADDAAAA